MRKERKYNYIYKTTCSVTGRYYIGMHSTDNLEDGYLGSGKRLWFSINYHGKENHLKEIIEFCSNRKELKQREEEIVNEQLINDTLCMNLMTGGQGGIISEEHQQKMKAGASKWMKEKWKDDKYRNKKSKESSERMKKNHETGKITTPDWSGKKHSEKTKKKMSNIKLGKGVGSSNSQFGTCWITNGEINKKIKKGDLDEFINSGWNKGRI